VAMHRILHRPKAEHARWIAGFILSRGLKHITTRDIYRSYRELKEKNAEKSAEEIARIMEALELANWVAPMGLEKGAGRYPTPRAWKVNEVVHTIFAGRAEEERTARALERTKIAGAVKAARNIKKARRLTEEVEDE
jgi:hypothetical protein